MVMELKDRILKIMNIERLTASVFADSIGVQRSSISHIISGRNKPSLEFIQKVLNSYPKYSTEWLIMGSGEAINNNKSDLNTTLSIPQSNSTLFNTDPKPEYEQKNTPINKTIKTVNNAYESSKSVLEAAKQTKFNDKTVDYIVIFYTDKTFSSYSPND